MAEITANERLEKIANMSLEMMQTRLEKNPGKINAGTLVKDTGEALKTLAEGIESYHRVAKTLKDDSVTKLWGS